MNEMDAEAFVKLRSNGALALDYSQLFSMNQTARLGELAQFHARQTQAQQQKNEWINRTPIK